MLKKLLFLFLCSAKSFAVVWNLPAVNIGTSTIPNPQIGVDDAGNAIAIWNLERFDGVNIVNVVQSATLLAGQTTWSTPVDVSIPTVFLGDQEPHIAVDSGGNAVAVWMRNGNGTTTVIQGARLPFGASSWTPTNDLSLVDSAGPEVQVDSAGNAIAVWSTATTITAAFLPFGSNSWQAFTLDLVSGGTFFDPHLAVNSSGQAVAIWTEDAGGGVQISEGATLPAGSMTWNAAHSLASTTVGNRVTLDNAGNALAIWILGSSTGQVQGARTTVSSLNPPWVNTSNLSVSGFPILGLALAIDPAGDAIALWSRELTSTNARIETANLDAGSSVWSTPIFISSPGAIDTNPEIDMDDSGNAIAVWERDSATTTESTIQGAQYFDGSWGSPTTLATAGQTSAFPHLAVNPTGFIAVVWLNQTLNTVQALTGQISAPVPPPSQPPVVTDVNPDFGPTAGGNSVTITGLNFINVTSVLFGSTPATSFVVNSSTSITAIAPAHAAGVVDVRVTTTAGTSPVSSDDKYTFQALPLPTVTAVNPNSGPVIGGNSVTITGTNFIKVTAVNFGTTPATSFIVNSSTSITAIAPSHEVGVVDVRVTTSVGTSAITPQDRYTYQQSVLLPFVTRVDPNTGSISGGNRVTITGINFINVSAVSFGTTPATSFRVVSPTSIIAIAPPHAAGVVDVRVTTAAGTSAISPQDRYRFFQAAPLPPTNFVGVILTDQFLNRTDLILSATWDPVPNVTSYRIFKNNLPVATIAASGPLIFKTCLSSRAEATTFSIASVDAAGNESVKAPITIVN